MNNNFNGSVKKTGFTNIKGEFFPNVKEISLKKEDLLHIGKFITETKKESNPFFDNELEGVYIYQSNINPSVAYRIYKEVYEYKFNGYCDDKLIENLRKKQDKITLSEFPTGIVTMEGRIIGQEIPFYEKYKTLIEYSTDSKKIININPIDIYIKVLKIIKELYENGIYYLDGHPKNFMINENGDIKIIDFDNDLIKIDELSEFNKQKIFKNLTLLINHLNDNFKISNKIEKIENINSFDECEEKILKMEHKLK